MAWSTESPANTIYDTEENALTVWDGGATIWDVVEGVIQTHWDVVDFTTTWSKEIGL